MRNLYLSLLFVVATTTLNSQPFQHLHIPSPGSKILESAVLPDVTYGHESLVNTTSDLGNPPGLNWVKRFGGDGIDVGQDIVTDNMGNIFVTGYFSGVVHFELNTLTSIGDKDAFVAKYSSTDSLLWVKQISCNAFEMAQGTGIALDSLNNVYVLGYYSGTTIQVGTATHVKTGLEDIFLAKYDDDGNYLASTHYGTSGVVTESKSIAVDDNGTAFIVAGGAYIATYGGNKILKFDSSFNLLWTYANGAFFQDVSIKNRIPYSPAQMPACISIDPPDATVYDSLTLTFNPSLACSMWASLAGSANIYMHSGVTINGSVWQYVVGYNGYGANGQSTQLTANGDGTYSIHFRPSAFYGLPPGLAASQLCMVFNDGQWGSKDGRDFDMVNGGCKDIYAPLNTSQTNIFLTGYINSAVSFGSTSLIATGWLNAPFVAKCDPTGLFSWAVQGFTTGSGEGYNRAFSVGIDKNENVFFSGRFNNNLTFGNYNLTNASGDYAPFIVKCNSSGNFEWARQAVIVHAANQYATYTTYASPVNVAIDSASNPYISCNLHNDTLVFGSSLIGGTGGAVAKYSSDGTEQWSSNAVGTINGISGKSGQKINYTGTSEGNVQIVQQNGAGFLEWVRSSFGNSGTAEFVSLELDNSGNLYGYGKTDAPDPMFGNVSGTFISKMNPLGGSLWTLPLIGGYYSSGYGDYLAVDSINNIFVMGYFADTLNIGGEWLVNYGDNNSIYVAKIDPSGSVIWLKQIGNGQFKSEEGSIDVDRDGNLIASGVFLESITIESVTLASSGNLDAFVVKYDGNGNFQWTKRAGGETTEYNGYVSVDSLNNIYLTGEFASRNITIDSYPLNLTEADGDVVLAKFTPAGVVSWSFAYGGDPTPGSYKRFYCWPTAIKTNSNGDNYIYGWTGKHNFYGPYLLESRFNWSFFLIKVNNSGVVQWAKNIKERGQNWHSMQIDIDNAGSCYVGGNLRDSTWFDNTVVTPQGRYDLFVAKYNLDGAFSWAKIFGSNPTGTYQTPAANFLNGIAVFDSNALFVGGSFGNALQFDATTIHTSSTNGFVSLLGDDLPVLFPPSDLTAILQPDSGIVNLNWNHAPLNGYFEDFNDGAAQNFRYSDNRFAISSGYLKLTGQGNDQWASAFYNQNYQNFVFEAAFQRQQGYSGSTIGFFIRSNGYIGTASDNGYLISFSTSGYYSAWRHDAGVETQIIPWTSTAAINTAFGIENVASVIANGSNFKIYINGSLVNQFMDNTYTSGKASVCTYMKSGYFNDVWWNYISLTTSIPFIPVNNTTPQAENFITGEGNGAMADFAPILNNHVKSTGIIPSETFATNASFLTFKIYRNGSVIDTTSQYTYADQLSSSGIYTYSVSALYDEGESDTCDPATVVWIPCPGTPTILYGGKIYETVQIGSQCWLKENLNIGTRIDGSLNQANNQTIEKYCYDNLDENCDIYGGLYQWDEIMQIPAPVMNIPEKSYTASVPADAMQPESETAEGSASAVGSFLAQSDSPLSILYDNGPLVNSPGTGAGGADESVIVSPINSYGTNFNTNPYLIADDFSITGSAWSISSFEFYGYQTGSSTSSSFTGVIMRIWNGMPGQTGSSVVWGDLITNRISSTSFTNIYRTNYVNGGVSRPIMKIIANTAGLTLAPGNYWVEWGCTGNLVSGPWCPPVTIGNTPVTGNAIQYGGSGTSYTAIQYGASPNLYPQGMPFKINGNTAIDFARGICPHGWHIPSDGDWSELTTYLGDAGSAGAKLKESGMSHWASPNTGATNNSGFTGLPGGYRYNLSPFYFKGYVGSWWSATPGSGTLAWDRYTEYNNINLTRAQSYKQDGLSVRCLKDNCPYFTEVNVSIVASGNPVAPGTIVTLTATSVNGGNNPDYQWDVNGVVVGTNSQSYTYTPAQGDVVKCIVTSDLPCTTNNPATSNQITMFANLGPCAGVPTVTYGGKTYNTMQIGNQCWFKENVNIGIRIDGVLNQTNNSIIEKYCQGNLESNCDIYGGLYQWAEMVQYHNGASNTASWNPVPGGDVKGICPTGWHLPSEGEWCTLTQLLDPTVDCNTIGMIGTDIGGKMKEPGTTHWLSPNSGATNSSGFTALPGGYRSSSDGGFGNINAGADYWPASEASASYAMDRYIYYNNSMMSRTSNAKTDGYSVRCVMNNMSQSLQLQNMTIPNGQSNCFNATQTITVAGNGSTFIIENGGSATLIAGKNIKFLSGARVNNGGYLHGYIATNGQFCGAQQPSMVASTLGVTSIITDTYKPFFIIYPNPTSGKFTIEINEDILVSDITIDIFGMCGEKVLSCSLMGERKREFSLSGKPSGIYFIRACSGVNSQSGKIIKQ